MQSNSGIPSTQFNNYSDSPLKVKNLQIFKLHNEEEEEGELDQVKSSTGRVSFVNPENKANKINIFQAALNYPESCFKVLGNEK